MYWGTLEIKELRKEYRDSPLCPNRPFKYPSPLQHYLYDGKAETKRLWTGEQEKAK